MIKPSIEQIQRVCATWAIETAGKSPIEIEALFWKALCERLLDGQLVDDTILIELQPPVCASHLPVPLYAHPKLIAEWTQHRIT